MVKSPSNAEVKRIFLHAGTRLEVLCVLFITTVYLIQMFVTYIMCHVPVILTIKPFLRMF